MKCPRCGHRGSRVSETRADDTAVWRYRTCKRCGHRWETSEMQDERIGCVRTRGKENEG